MIGFENITILLPESLRGDFAFYPLIILIASLLIVLAAGVQRGFMAPLGGIRNKRRDDETKPLIEVFCIIQTICLLLIILSVFFHYHPRMKTGAIESEVGFGFAVVTSFVVFITAPAAFAIFDRMVLMAGETPAIVYRFSMAVHYEIGAKVVQTVQKHSHNPGPRAREIYPEKHGDYIDYVVDKFRRVVSVGKDRVTLITRRGKLVQVDVDDPMVRKAGFFERLRYHKKFPPEEMISGWM